jgi:hypothetical protein
MRLLPYLFQFCSTRHSDISGAEPIRQAPQNQTPAQQKLFYAFRSPSDQLCVVVMRSWQIDDRGVFAKTTSGLERARELKPRA